MDDQKARSEGALTLETWINFQVLLEKKIEGIKLKTWVNNKVKSHS